MTLKLFFCVLFVTYCFTVTLAQVPDCCTPDDSIPVINIVEKTYDMGISQGCSIDAVILEISGGEHLCVPDNDKVKGLKKCVEWKNKNKKLNIRCHYER